MGDEGWGGIEYPRMPGNIPAGGRGSEEQGRAGGCYKGETGKERAEKLGKKE